MSVKVVTNCRIPGRKKPVQIHLGYLSLMFDGGIPQGQRAKLLKNLRRKWMDFFQTEEVDVDWADAESKLDLLRISLASGAPNHPDPNPALLAAPADHEHCDADGLNASTMRATSDAGSEHETGAGAEHPPPL
jgi:hypothetical protein